jgi:[protein-PII] uridylyltransferase
MSQLAPNVMAAKDRLAAGYEKLEGEHLAGAAGVALCRRIADLRDGVIRELFDHALASLRDEGRDALAPHVALVAHGGYGRRDVAPFSDVDLMILYADGLARGIAPLAQRLLRDVFDASLMLGQSVRTAGQACRLAMEDPAVCTSLVESRLLAGDAALFERFQGQFRRQIQQRCRPLMAAILKARRDERHRYGETIFLLQPNVKQSPGTLRDLQLLRWIGLVRYGAAEPARLHDQGVLSAEDLRVVDGAYEFLLSLRNELHFDAKRASDVLDRAAQVRIAGRRGYRTSAALLPVEQFMRDYFRHTGGVSHVVERFVATAQSWDRVARLAAAVFGHRVEGGVRVGITGMFVTREGLESLQGNLVEIMRLVGLSNLYDKPIAPATWEVIRREAARLPDALPAEACHRFLALLAHPARLGTLLRDLHDIGVLERFIPEFEHARGLLQFNEYHQYTVDEHCLRAVELATDLRGDSGPLGRAYTGIKQKHVLHLALLIHDLGKGFRENHHVLGEKVAGRAAARLAMPSREADTLKFLVREHDRMNHLAFRRDTSDEQLVVRFAVEVGSPERLRMLYVMTAADLAAVGPRVWDGWKNEVLASLYDRAMEHLAGDYSPVGVERLRQRAKAVARSLGRQRDLSWFERHLDGLPAGYLAATDLEQIADDLLLLREVQGGGAIASARYLPESAAVQFTVATSEQVTPGIFHKLTGALGRHGLQIRSAEIHTLADGLVLDRFRVHDPDYAGEPPSERLEQVSAGLVESLRAADDQRPSFRRLWQADKPTAGDVPRLETRVEVDNTTSDRYTILDVFTADRPGLLYAITRTLFEQGLSVARARIATHGDQVVDVFYVTDREGKKIVAEPQLESIRRQVSEVLDRVD